MFEKHSLFSLTNRMTKIADHVWQAGKGYLTMGSESLSQKALNINPIHQTDTHQGEPLPSLLSMLQNGVSWFYQHPKKILLLMGLALSYSARQQDQRDHDSLGSQREMNVNDVFAHQAWESLTPQSTQMLSQMGVAFSVMSLRNHPNRYSQAVSFLTPLNLMTLSSVLPMLNAQITQMKFLKIFGGNLTDIGSALITTPSGEIVMAGYTTSFGAGDRDVLLAKLFSNGSLAWARTLGGNSTDRGYALITTPTGEIVVAGFTDSFGAGNLDVLVAKLFGNGSLAWARTLGGSSDDYGRALITTTSGEIVVAGFTRSFGAGNTDVLVAKLFGNGSLVWARTLGGNGNSTDRGYALITTPSGEIVVAGDTTSFGAGGADVLVAKLFSNGSLAWARTLGGSLTDIGRALITTPSGEIVVAGYTTSFGAGDRDVLLAKLFSNGSLAWARTLGGSNNDHGLALITTPSAEILVAGFTLSFGVGDRDVLVAKLFGNGSLAWTRTLGESNGDYGYALSRTPTGEIVVAGSTGSLGFEDVLLAKLDANGTVPGCANISTIQPTFLDWTSINTAIIVPTFTSLNITEISIQDWTTISTQFITPQELFLCSGGNLSMSTQSSVATSAPVASSIPTSNNSSGTSQTAASLLTTFSSSTSTGTDVSSRSVVTTNNPSNSFTSAATTQSRAPIIFSVTVSTTAIVVESGISTTLTTNHLSLTGNANPSEVVYTVQGNNPDVVITVNGTEATLFTHADIIGQFVEITLQASGCQDYFNTELQASSAGSGTTVDVGLIFEVTTLSCNEASRLADTAILNTALLFTTAGLGFWAKGQDKKQNEQRPQNNPSTADIQSRH